MLKSCAERLTGWFTSRNRTLLCQGEGLERSAMLEKFRRDGSAVLFGTDSFWQGVDVPGDALQNVVITKLPFSVPDNPLLEAIKTLQQDSFVKEKFDNHNPDYGYNEFVGYVEENCVRTLDQIVSEAYGIARDPHQRWRESHRRDLPR